MVRLVVALVVLVIRLIMWLARPQGRRAHVQHRRRARRHLAAPPGPAVQPGEPSGALWQGAAAQVRYTFDPTTYSRVLEIIGPQAEPLRHHLQSHVG